MLSKINILKYCEKDILIEREQYYLNTLKLEYNILKAASNSKHSFKTKALMTIMNSGENNAFFGKRHTREIRIRISESLKSSVAFSNSVNLRPKTRKSETLNKLSLRSHGVRVKAFVLIK